MSSQYGRDEVGKPESLVCHVIQPCTRYRKCLPQAYKCASGTIREASTISCIAPSFCTELLSPTRNQSPKVGMRLIPVCLQTGVLG